MTSSLMAAVTDQVGDADVDGFELDVRIVESSPSVAALLGGTDDGCNTVRGSDC